MNNKDLVIYLILFFVVIMFFKIMNPTDNFGNIADNLEDKIRGTGRCLSNGTCELKLPDKKERMRYAINNIDLTLIRNRIGVPKLSKRRQLRRRLLDAVNKSDEQKVNQFFLQFYAGGMDNDAKKMPKYGRSGFLKKLLLARQRTKDFKAAIIVDMACHYGIDIVKCK